MGITFDRSNFFQSFLFLPLLIFKFWLNKYDNNFQNRSFTKISKLQSCCLKIKCFCERIKLCIEFWKVKKQRTCKNQFFYFWRLIWSLWTRVEKYCFSLFNHDFFFFFAWKLMSALPYLRWRQTERGMGVCISYNLARLSISVCKLQMSGNWRILTNPVIKTFS